jgi:benzoyl-CoA 2,3-dioxygenase component B
VGRGARRAPGALRRIIVTQADTEPASVEQQRLLGRMAPSLYDMRNLFQVNVEEGRHLWAMVYLLHKYFGKDGRDEAEALLERRSGDPDKPRILGPSTSRATTGCRSSRSRCSPTATASSSSRRCARAASNRWRAPASSCSPRRRSTCSSARPGMERIIRARPSSRRRTPTATCGARAASTSAPAARDQLLVLYCLDLFGSELSSNAGGVLRRRPQGPLQGGRALHRPPRSTQHRTAADASRNGRLVEREVPLRNAMNEVLRDDYIADCERAVRKWNHMLEEMGSPFRMTLPSAASTAARACTPSTASTPRATSIDAASSPPRDEWLLSEGGQRYLRSIMVPVPSRGSSRTGSPRPAAASAARTSSSRTCAGR